MAGRNPLFPRAFTALQRDAVNQFRATELGRLVTNLRRTSRRSGPAELARLQSSLRNLSRSGAIRNELMRTPLGSLIGDVERYARGGKFSLMDRLFGALGPLGSIVQSLLRPNGRQIGDLEKELETAANMLEMFGYKVQRPGQFASSQVGVTSVTPPGVNLNAAKAELEALGFTVTPPTPGQSQPLPLPPKPTLLPPQSPMLPPRPGPVPPSRPVISRPGVGPDQTGSVTSGSSSGSGVPGNLGTTPPVEEKPKNIQRSGDSVVIRVGGDMLQVNDNDPLITGKMIEVQSSNVHSIGFIWNNANPRSGTLKIKFKDKRKNGPKSGRGATYYYYDVHPKMFMAFSKAASKGKWVWDNLRIRGTVSGHRKTYSLQGLASDGYVPRRAVRIGNEEWYVQRTVTAANGKEYRSKLADQMVQMWKPNRGKPNNGRPNRGR